MRFTEIKPCMRVRVDTDGDHPEIDEAFGTVTGLDPEEAKVKVLLAGTDFEYWLLPAYLSKATPTQWRNYLEGQE